MGQEYPNGEAVQVLYSAYGHGIAEKEPVSGVEYRRTNTQNPRGQTTQETFGNGVILTPTYQFQTGQLTGLTYSNTGGTLRQLGYGYDVYGNLKRQSLGGGASREDYSYDQLHRLVQSIRSGAASGTVNYGFDAVGNLTKKSDFSSNTSNAYSYTGATCGGGANAVKSVALAAGGTRTYCYDANGNLTSDNAGLSLKYDHQNLPIVAQRGALRDDFRYGPDGMRTRSWGSDGARVYLPGYEHRTDTGETKVYIGDYAVISKTGSTRKVEYLLKDRLGSVDAVANSSGAVTETRGYDAFGKPRNGTWNDLSPAKIASTAVTPKGFTQHEHLNELELIHMNGRMYDYNVGRFMGVDPFIQFPLNSQSLNPYSYILNNPLSGTDPTGYACSTGTNIKGGGGPNCDSTGAQGGAVSETPTFNSNRPKPGVSGGNGGSPGQLSISEGRNESRRGAASSLKSAVSRIFLPNAQDLQDRGEPGTSLDDARGFGKGFINTGVGFVNTVINAAPVPGIYNYFNPESQIAVPEVNISNKELPGAFASNVVVLLASAFAPKAAAKGGGEVGAPKPVQRSGPRGLDPDHHNANVMVRDANGNVISHDRVVSGSMTPAEKALGFPRNTLASHTEARAVTQVPLNRGDSLIITGQRPPCPSCKGYMNRASTETGAIIRYQWREGGQTKRWTATGQ